MKVLVKPIKNEENPLVEGYCDYSSCQPVTVEGCRYGNCQPLGSVSEDVVNLDDEILF
jgi:hypothetical protein